MKNENVVNKIKNVMLNSFQHPLHFLYTNKVEILNQVQDDNMIRTAHGFTLIELLVVVLIIGILAAVAVPQYQMAVTKSRYAALKHIVKSIADAQQAYYLANNKYATDFDALDVDMPGGTIEHEYAEGETDVEAKKKRQRYYPWGHCYTSNGAVACMNNLINMRYTIYAGGQQECVAYNTQDETSIAARVCKAETNSTPTPGKTSGIFLLRYYY